MEDVPIGAEGCAERLHGIYVKHAGGARSWTLILIPLYYVVTEAH